MVVVMTGSVKPEAYPGPSAQVWANRAVSEKAQASAQKKGYNELKDATMSKKQQELMAKKEAKALAEAKFKADQEKRRAKEAAERAVRKDVRGQSLATIEGERQKARAEARMKEENDAAMARLRIAEQNSGMQFEDQVEAVIDAGDSEFQAQVAKTALAQRKMQEENDARHEAEAKAEREAKAAAKESADKQKRDDEMKRQRDEAYRIKKEMAAETRRQKVRRASSRHPLGAPYLPYAHPCRSPDADVARGVRGLVCTGAAGAGGGGDQEASAGGAQEERRVRQVAGQGRHPAR